MHGNLSEHVFDLLWGLAFDHGTANHRGSDGVYRDTMRCVFFSTPLHKADQTGFCHVVGRHIGVSFFSRNGSNVHNPSVASLDHVGQDRHREQDCSSEID